MLRYCGCYPWMYCLVATYIVKLSLISTPLSYLQLTFSYFNLEPHSTCGWDSVTIFNGGSPGSPVIGQYCGTISPGTIQSGANNLAVVFLADHSVSRGGFVASWFADSSGGFILAKLTCDNVLCCFIVIFLCDHFMYMLCNYKCLLLARLWRGNPCWYRNNQVSKLSPEFPSQCGMFLADHFPWGNPPGDECQQWFRDSRQHWDLSEQLFQGISS